MADNRISKVHAPQYLQDVAIGFQPRGLVADQICPRSPVAKQSDYYPIFGKLGFLEKDAKRAPTAAPNAVRFDFSKDQYFADEYALRADIPKEELANADTAIDIEMQYTEMVTNMIAIARERRVASLFTTTGNYAGSHVTTKAGGSEWDTLLATNPTQVITDVEAAIAAVKGDTGLSTMDLTVVVPEMVFDKTMKHNSAMLDRVKYSQLGVMTPDLIRQIWNVKAVVLAAVRSGGSGNENTGTAPEDIALSELWSDNVWVGMVAQGASKFTPTFARTFSWAAATNNQPREVLRYEDPDPGTRKIWVEVAEAMSEKITYKGAGAIITNVLA